MNTPFILLSGLLGLVAGSFCAAASWRFVRNISVVRPASSCPACGRKLTPLELIPLFSYILLQGLCIGCKTRISLRYPLMEALYAAIAMVLATRFGPSPSFAVLFVLTGLLLTASAIDAQTLVLPDCLTLPCAVAAMPCAVLWLGRSPEDSAAGLLFGAGVPWLLRWILLSVRGKEALGLGDVKLMAGLGGLCGLSGLPPFFLGSALSALAWLLGLAVLQLLKNRPLTETPVPFGPFLSLGALLTLLWGEYFWMWWLALL